MSGKGHGYNLPDGCSSDDLPGEGNEVCAEDEVEFNPDNAIFCRHCDDVFCSLECRDDHTERQHTEAPDDEA